MDARAIRRRGLAAGAIALAAFVVLSATRGVPQGPEGTLIAGTLQTRIQIGLLVVAAVGLAVGARHPLAGGAILVVAATGIGVFAAFEYRPLVALVPFLGLLVPAVLLLAGGLSGRSRAAGAAVAAVLLLVIAASGLAAREVYDRAFGPTHPASTVRLADGPVRWIWAGPPEGGRVEVAARLDDPGAEVALRIGPGDPAAGRPVAPSARTAEGVVRFDVGGLRPGRAYRYALEVDGHVDGSRVGRLRVVPEGPASFTMAFGGCARRGSNGRVFDAIRALHPDLYLLLGDMYYADIATDDPDRFRSELDRALTRPGQQALYLAASVAYVWDDHDYGPDDADGTSPTRDAAQAVYREYVPHATLAGGAADGPINQAFTLGRVRVIVLDLRSERDPSSVPDGPAKTMLGDRQARWLTGQLGRARRDGQVAVLVSSVPWIAAPAAGSDDWAGYARERARISRTIARLGLPAVILGGDAHMVAIDDGSHSDYSGTGRAHVPVAHGAALDRPGGTKGGPYSAGTFPGGGQFGTMTVRDDGTVVRITLSGRDWRGRTLVEETFALRP